MQLEPWTHRREYVRMYVYGVRHMQPEWCTFGLVYVYVFVYGGRQVQPEPCTYRREYVRMCVYGVRYVRTEWCIFRANVGVRMPICCSPCAVRAVYPKSVACVVYPLHATDVDLLSDAPTVRKGACVDLHLVYERAQCLALAA